MTILIMPNEMTLKEAITYMEKLTEQGFDCWFKTVANKDKGTLEVHLIIQDKDYTVGMDVLE